MLVENLAREAYTFGMLKLNLYILLGHKSVVGFSNPLRSVVDIFLIIDMILVMV
jgi:hypothetical protein